MSIPYIYIFQNLRMRRTTVAITIAGITLVVFVFTAVLMMSHGVEKTLADTGSKDNVIITRKGSSGEISSIVPGETQSIIRTLPHIQQTADGIPLMSTDVVVIINLNKESGGMANVTVRGVSTIVQQLRPNIQIIQGKMFNPALRQLIVGQSIYERFPEAQLGKKIKFAGDLWEIVGVFTMNGGGYESEIWGNSEQLLNAFNRGNAVSSVTLKLNSGNDLDAFKKSFREEIRLSEFEVDTESGFFAKQSEALAMFIRLLGLFITVIFSIGAMVGAAITMYGAVANRTVEIGTLRSLGFGRRSVLTVFLLESVAISLIGALLGVLLASSLQFMKLSTLNFTSFSEIVFSLALSPEIIITAIIFGVVMGILGGFLPAVRASRLNIVNALRAG